MHENVLSEDLTRATGVERSPALAGAKRSEGARVSRTAADLRPTRAADSRERDGQRPHARQDERGAPADAGPERSDAGPERAASPLVSWRPSARLDPIERFARFEILGRIGRGGMAEILLARERSPAGGARHLVIKRVLPEALDVDDMLHMFLDEARIVMGLSHPNLCQIYDIGEHEGTWFIAMEWVNGVTLNQLIRRAIETGDLDYEVLTRIAAQCAEALHYAHAARDSEGQLMNLVHRDVSPHNIMAGYDGRVKLLDFGIAKSSATTHKTEAGVVKGKVCYMSPEQWLRQPLDGRADVFALGACLYEALSGRVAFKRDSQMEVMKAALSGDVPRLSMVTKDVPEALVEITHRALETYPARRFQSARELGDALERFLANLSAPVGPARIAEYVRRLFRDELQLGPVLERSARGAQLGASAGLVLPPLPPSLLGMARPPGSLRPLPPPPFALFGAAAPAVAPPAQSPSDVTPPSANEPSRANEPRLDGSLACAQSRRELVAAGPELPPFSDAPTRPTVPTPCAPELGEQSPRPPAPTLSMRAAGRAWRAALAAAVVLVAALAIGARSALIEQPRAASRRAVPAAFAPPEPALLAAPFPTPAFTFLPASAPLTEPPELEPDEPEHASAENTGRLSINTRPWSTVYLGKRLLGSTPLADVPVPRGTLVLKLVDRDGRVHMRRLRGSREKRRSVHFEF